MIEQVVGKPSREYCSAGHRAAGRRLRGAEDDWEIEAETGAAAGRTSGTARESRNGRESATERGPASGRGAADGRGPGASREAEPATARAARSGTAVPAPPPRTASTPAPAPRAHPSTAARPAEPARPAETPAARAAHPVPPARSAPSAYDNGSAADLTDDVLVRRRVERPSSGWRRAVFSVSGGLVNPGVSEAEAARNVLLRRVRRHLPGAHQIAVSSLKGGVGKTTVSAVLGLTLAEHRGDRVVAVDANPDAGTLADRLTGEIGVTVRQMLDNIESIDSLTAVSHYTSLAGRLQVLASEQDPAMSEAFNRGEYEAVCAVLARFYNIIITDSGTGLVHSAMEGTLALADSLVVVGSPTVDGASRASKTLDWLVAHGYAEQVADAVVVLSCDRVSPEIDRERVRGHFASRSRAVVEVPYDPHLATGGRLDLAAMRQPTRDAFLELAALIADEFSA
jgi:MinD-like ATPase involved in chromosome partitioning or flagellar assembly